MAEPKRRYLFNRRHERRNVTPGAIATDPGAVQPREPVHGRIGILRPLRIRDFRLLWSGMTVSLIGDGMFTVALAWQVYQLSNAPTALSIVGLALSTPMVVFLLVGGIVSDRFDRRRIMIAADVLRGVTVAVLGVLSVVGVLELWHVVAIVALFAVGDAFFYPAFGAVVPQVVPQDMLLEANSLDQFVRPGAQFMLGPALGGIIIATFGDEPGAAFLVDAATFGVSALAIALMRPLSRRRPTGAPSALRELKEGFAFVRSETWLWATLLIAAITLFLFWGPFQVLVPFIVKNRLGGDAGDLGLVMGTGGVGAIVASFVMGQRGLPRRHIVFLYIVWAVATFAMVFYGMARGLWMVAMTRMVGAGLASAGLVVWGTLMHRLVPTHLLGRATSFDWFISIGLVPLSYAVTGPIAETIGVGATLIGAGLIGGPLTLAFLLIPGIRDTEHDERLHPSASAAETSAGRGANDLAQRSAE